MLRTDLRTDYPFTFLAPTHSPTYRRPNVTSALQLGAAWPMFRRNQYGTAQSPFKGSSSGTLRWTYTTGGGVTSSPVIASDGTIYFGASDGLVYAINSQERSLKWTYNTRSLVEGSATIASDGTVYIGTSYPTVSLFALNHIDGSAKWTFVSNSGFYNRGSPALGADGTIYIIADHNLYSLHPVDGRINWSFTASTNILMGNAQPNAAIGSDGVVYFAKDPFLYAVFPTNGTSKWSQMFSNANLFSGWGTTISSPAIAFNIFQTESIYIGIGAIVFAINAANGTTQWTYTTGGSIIASPVIASDGTVYIGKY